jgi:hypothetical protein
VAKPLVDESIDQEQHHLPRSFRLLVYPSALDLSTSTLTFLAERLAAHRAALGSRWRKLPPARQALLVLAHLRCGDTYARLAAGFGVGVATVYRYVREALDLLAALAPSVTEAVRLAATKAYAILDGTLIPIDRVADQRPYYSGKHRRHGVNVQILADALGRLLWASPALPGATHDLTAARTYGLVDALAEAHVTTLADKGYQGAGGTIRTPYKGRHLPENMRAVNRSHARMRGVGEQAVATAKNWRILRKVRCSPTRIGTIVAAVLTLHLQPTT